MCYFEVTSIFLRRQNFEGWYPVCENVLIFASDSTFNPRIFVCSQIRCWIVLCWKKNSIGLKQSQRGSARFGCSLLRFALAEYFFLVIKPQLSLFWTGPLPSDGLLKRYSAQLKQTIDHFSPMFLSLSISSASTLSKLSDSWFHSLKILGQWLGQLLIWSTFTLD